MRTMPRRVPWALLTAGCLVILIALSRHAALSDAPAASSGTTSALPHHGAYRDYDFGQGRDIIDVGTQPLWIPTNLITEAMQRDAILSESLARRGLTLRFHAFFKGADVNDFIRSGDLEAGIGGDMPALVAAAEGRIQIAALAQYGFCSIVAGHPVLLHELGGKRIAYASGSNAYFALLRALSAGGLTEADIERIALDVHEMPSALAAGGIDAFAAWQPTPFIAESHYGNQVVVHQSLCSGYLYFSQTFSEQQPDALRQIVAAELRAVGWLGYRKNRLRAARWALEKTEAFSRRLPRLNERDYAALAWNDLIGIASIPSLPEADLLGNGRLAREFELLRRLDKIDDNATWEQVRRRFDRSLIADVLSTSRRQLQSYDYREAGSENHESR